MKVLNIPIEPLEDRYSKDWDGWFKSAFGKDETFETETIYGDTASGKITSGAFLDVAETNKYKTEQLNKILDYIINHYDKNEKLVLFFHDLWFPGILNIAYVRDGLGLKNLKITGCMHAGSYDPHDFVSKKMGKWAWAFETALFSVVDKVFLATDFHKLLLSRAHHGQLAAGAYGKLHVTGFPIQKTSQMKVRYKKRNIIVFPHRLDDEKMPEQFDQLQETFKKKYPDWAFIKTKEACETKKEYYAMLKKAKIAISFAQQETWGIAMQEALFCGCLPLVPDRLSYKEMYPMEFRYTSISDLYQKVETAIKANDVVNIASYKKIADTENHLLKKGEEAIPTIINELKEWL